MLSYITKYVLSVLHTSQRVSFFSERQLDIMYKIVKGKSTFEIAEELEISQMALHIYIKSIYKTLYQNRHDRMIDEFISQDLKQL